MAKDMSILADVRAESPVKSASGRDLQVRGQGRYAVERRIPKPYPFEKFGWKPEQDIGRIPAVSAREFGSPARLLPSVMHEQNARGRSTRELRKQPYVTRPPQGTHPLMGGINRKWIEDRLRLLPQRLKANALLAQRILRG